MKVKLVVEAEVPQDCFQDFLKIIINFNDTYPDCDIQISATTSDMATKEVEQMLAELDLETMTMKKQ